MKTALITICAIISISVCFSQNNLILTQQNFEEQILSYVPKMHPDIDENQFEYGKMILSQTKSATNGEPQNFNAADYLNILSAFLTLKESQNNINLAYEKLENAQGSCKYFMAFESKFETNPKYAIIRNRFREKLKKCHLESNETSNEFDLKKYSIENNLNPHLIQIVNQIKVNDQKYRSGDLQNFKLKQKELDLRNQEVVDSLYDEHGSYIGKSLVGEELDSVMWAVIQHSNMAMMEKYLPIIQDAVKDKELSATPLKMLIDRYYGLAYGYQIFGSQNGFGFKLADDKTRKEVEIKYGLE